MPAVQVAPLGPKTSVIGSFVGFGFEDPTLNSIPGEIRLLLDENIRNHHCFMKKAARVDPMSDKAFKGISHFLSTTRIFEFVDPSI